MRVLYDRAFININITQLHKPMMSQFDDRLIIGYGETMISLKKLEFRSPTAYVKHYFHSHLMIRGHVPCTMSCHIQVQRNEYESLTLGYF